MTTLTDQNIMQVVAKALVDEGLHEDAASLDCELTGAGDYLLATIHLKHGDGEFQCYQQPQPDYEGLDDKKGEELLLALADRTANPLVRRMLPQTCFEVSRNGSSIYLVLDGMKISQVHQGPVEEMPLPQISSGRDITVDDIKAMVEFYQDI